MYCRKNLVKIQKYIDRMKHICVSLYVTELARDIIQYKDAARLLILHMYQH